MERWSNGAPEQWSAGVMERWSNGTGVMELESDDPKIQ